MVDKFEHEKGDKGKKSGGKKKDHKDKEAFKQASKTLCYILRHESAKYGLNIEKDGFVKVSDLLETAPVKKLNVNKDFLQKIVDSDEKGRYELKDNMIRCVQGHSNVEVDIEEASEPITTPNDYHLVVHGTYSDAWEKIKSSGLNKMKRAGVHFAIGYPKDENVKSGMRGNCDIFVEVNLPMCHANGIKFFLAKNNVILSTGEQGIIDTKYFKIVHNQAGEVLMSQK
jgi:2'-phosphotransferase